MSNFQLLEVPVSLMDELITLINSEKWVDTGSIDITEIPQWLDLSYIPHNTDIQLDSYDENKSYWCPKVYIDWSHKVMQHFGQKFQSLSFELWNGAGDDNWHIDDDGGKYLNKIFMIYHTPQPLDLSDGGFFEYLENGNVKSVIPTTGTCISFNCANSLHRAVKMKSKKPRYTVLIRCLTDILKTNYNSQSRMH